MRIVVNWGTWKLLMRMPHAHGFGSIDLGYGFVRKFSKRFVEELNFIQERNTSLKWEAVSWGLKLNPGRYSATQLYHQGKPQADTGKPLKWCSPWGAMLKSLVVSSWVGPALDDHEGNNWNSVHFGSVESTPPGIRGSSERRCGTRFTRLSLTTARTTSRSIYALRR